MSVSGDDRGSAARGPLDDLLGELITVTHRLTRLAAHATGSTESPAIWRTLSVLGSEGPMRLGELAGLSRVAQPTMTKIVAKLVATGWVERIQDAADGRVTLLAITTAGHRAYTGWLTRLTAELVPLFEDLDERETDALRITIDVLRARTAVAIDGDGEQGTAIERTGTEA